MATLVSLLGAKEISPIEAIGSLSVFLDRFIYELSFVEIQSLKFICKFVSSSDPSFTNLPGSIHKINIFIYFFKQFIKV